MENAVVALISIALLLFGAVAIVQSTVSSVDMLSTSWKEMEALSGEIARTDIAATTAEVKNGRTIAEVTVANQGQTSLANFSKWDVIVQYFEEGDIYRILRADYTTTDPPPENQWRVAGIFLDTGAPEVFAPNILNPGEKMVIRVKLPSPIKVGSNFLVAVATPNGVATAKTF